MRGGHRDGFSCTERNRRRAEASDEDLKGFDGNEIGTSSWYETGFRPGRPKMSARLEKVALRTWSTCRPNLRNESRTQTLEWSRLH